MATLRCPGQDKRFWKPKDIFEVQCPYCAKVIEFWKDDPLRYCLGCGKEVRNPRIDLGCAKWCQYAEECLGIVSDESVTAIPVVERLKVLLDKHFIEQPVRMNHVREVSALTETFLTTEGGDPCVVKAAALLAGALMLEGQLISTTSSQEYPPLGDFHARKAILEQSGIEPSRTDEICAIVEAVISGKPWETPEFEIVWDVVQLERLSLIHDSDTSEIDPIVITKAIRTRTGKRLAERFNGRKDTFAEKNKHGG
jgi:hypothetical protein